MANTEAPFYFPGVTLLITHYNRSGSLERLLSACRERGCSFDDIVVSDDGSKPEHLGALKRLQGQYGFQLVTTPVNRGLGNNINKGQDAVKTPYTLYVQEDFVPTPAFPGHFRDALEIMKAEDKWDLIAFYSYAAYPYLRPYKKGFSEKLYKPWYINYKKIYAYSDHPHLRKSDFLKKFGRYVEGIKSDKTEYLMCVSFIKNKGQSLFFNEYKSLFDQVNPEDEPSTVTRTKWTQSNNLFIVVVRDIYRQIKYNYDLHVAK
ncbi:glycosyltransferase [Rufibacter tibetensis]|uniref:Glycosyl transferase family 2 n=1 Tax=Rufibacter tibetensis TaxID=512763 RepID=A0A0N7HWQ3_9BACT|nr:glycosyltransferase [Rufibacter tibetensis]ALI99888.1 glycosyl transferase family 2 [Rufibacter tibetensis]